MTGFWFQLLALVAATNPAGAALATTAPGRARLLQGVAAASVALGVLIIGILAADPVLSALDVSPESFRTAAGIVMAAQGARMAWDPASTYRPGNTVFDGALPLGWPVVANAAAVMAAVSFAADGSDARVALAALLACVVSGVFVGVRAISGDAARGGARLLGAFLVAAAAAVVVSGVRDV